MKKVKSKIFLRTKSGDKGMRLDQFLVYHGKTFSRSMVQQTIKMGNVTVDGKITRKAGTRLKPFQEISMVEMIKERGVETVIPQKMDIHVIYKDKDVVVVNKQSGVVVHPGTGNKKNTLLNGLVYRYRKLQKIGKNVRLGLVHRIDKETSGIILVALSDYAHWYLSRQFENREVDKKYLTVVGGDIRKSFGQKKKVMITNYIGRDPKDRLRQAIVRKEKGKHATSIFHAISTIKHHSLGTITLLLVTLKTGRTHQIRTQLSSLGYPVVGDRLYGGIPYKRMLLHAYILGVTMLDGTKRSFKASIPTSFVELFDKNEICHTIKKTLRKYYDKDTIYT